ncbi:hypothetical protein CC78DRAFT_566612 [Lojkania enalia]|uniref:F-box domain-containing protein n=1 Tax=Lojkania enalia TaxID=147567 RepID=A0A9P4KDX2_9PLEO|nr:hypothetical protein CC78DRAFT_566612 [Didymosphaeria enalia]
MEIMTQQKELAHAYSSPFLLLSIDLKLEVFDFVRSKIDQGNARLVSQEWNRLMKPRMWRDFTSGLRGTFAKDIESLVNEKHDCLHDIRKLNIGGRHLGPDYDSHFSSFMHLLRENQLLEFRSAKEAPINPMQLLCLLRRQSSLRSFSARLDFSDTSAQNRVSWIINQIRLLTPALPAIRSLRIYVRDRASKDDHEGVSEELEMACTRLLIDSASLLEDLEICGWRLTQIDRIPITTFFSHTAKTAYIPKKLRRLLLCDIDFCNQGSELFEIIDVSALHSLELRYCDRMGPFFCALAASIRQLGTQLKVLTVRARNNEISRSNRNIVQGVNALLCSFAGLEELELAFLQCGFIDWKESLGPHRDSLKRVLISSTSMCDGITKWPQMIAFILAQCPHVQQFAYLPSVTYLGKVADCKLPCSLDTPLLVTLDSVVTAPSVRVLRLLYAPGFWNVEKAHRQEPSWAEKAGRMAHRFATLVLRYLELRGSHVKLLAISPISRWEQARSDSNRHYYPHYYYRREMTEVDGNKVVEAVPFPDCLAEWPDATILRSV